MQIGFDSPEYLWLLLGGVPIIAWLAWHHLGMIGHVRAATTLLFRLLVLTTLVVAIAGIRVNWSTDPVTVIYFLDQSDSDAPGCILERSPASRPTVPTHSFRSRFMC